MPLWMLSFYPFFMRTTTSNTGLILHFILWLHIKASQRVSGVKQQEMQKQKRNAAHWRVPPRERLQQLARSSFHVLISWKRPQPPDQLWQTPLLRNHRMSAVNTVQHPIMRNLTRGHTPTNSSARSAGTAPVSVTERRLRGHRESTASAGQR